MRLPRTSVLVFLILGAGPVFAQSYWQQRVEYTMDVTIDVHSHRYEGTQTLVYFNNSPDTLTRIFYHLFPNAFHTGSSMDLRTHQLPDPDRRILRMEGMSPEEEGYLHVLTLTQNGTQLKFEENETILEVTLDAPVLPGDSATFYLTFTGQVSRQVRRSGRDNAEGISYSMTQWYPKLAAYDTDGWHPDPYILREFYGDYGSFDVTIGIDEKFIVAGTGHLVNAGEIGYGYTDEPVKRIATPDGKLKWHFIADNVHDFAWAADPDYTHVSRKRSDGLTIHYFYQPSESTQSWAEIPDLIDTAFDFINANFGRYPYSDFSFIQGGDGGMEYPMATLISGGRSLVSLMGAAIHELMHSWYYGVIGTNESVNQWMDEGFANHAGAHVFAYLREKELLPGDTSLVHPFYGDYRSYFRVVERGLEEPMSTFADHFMTNTAYGVAAYSKGNAFLAQLSYIIGEDAFKRTLLRYYNTWKFRHPKPHDFLRIAEKESGLVLDWYYEYWILTTKTIDYAIGDVSTDRKETVVTLKRIGEVPMPLEIHVTDIKGNSSVHYIPLDLMRGNKPGAGNEGMTIEADWRWAAREYTLTIPQKSNRIARIEIDPSQIMADVDRSNNVYQSDDNH